MCRFPAHLAIGMLALLALTACERVKSESDINPKMGPSMMQMMHPETPDDRSSTAVDSGLVK